MTLEEHEAIEAHEAHLRALQGLGDVRNHEGVTDDQVAAAFDALRASWSALVAVADLRGITAPERAAVTVEFLTWWQGAVDRWFRARTVLLELVADRAGFSVLHPEHDRLDGEVSMYGRVIGLYGFQLPDD